MLRRLLAALLVAVAIFFARSASADEKAPTAPTIDLYTIGAGDYFYARFGHTILCVRPGGSDIAKLEASCYDYGVPSSAEFFSIGWGAVRNHVDFIPIVVPEKTRKVVLRLEALIFSIRIDIRKTKASGASIATHLSGVPKIAWVRAGLLATAKAVTPVTIRPMPM